MFNSYVSVAQGDNDFSTTTSGHGELAPGPAASIGGE